MIERIDRTYPVGMLRFFFFAAGRLIVGISRSTLGG
jgi:hypothetical protein